MVGLLNNCATMANHNECENYHFNVDFPQVVLDTTKEQIRKLNKVGGTRIYHRKVVNQMLKFCEENYNRLLVDKNTGAIDFAKATELEKEFLLVIKDLKRRRDAIEYLMYQEQIQRIPSCSSISKYISQLYEQLVIEKQKYEFEKKKREAFEARAVELQRQLEHTCHALRLQEERERLREKYKQACLEEEQVETARKVTKAVDDARRKMQEAEQAAVSILVQLPRIPMQQTIDVLPTAEEVSIGSPKRSYASPGHPVLNTMDHCHDPSDYTNRSPQEDNINLSLPQIVMRKTRKQIEKFKASSNKILYVSAFDHLLDLNETLYRAFLRAKATEDMDPEKAKKVEDDFILIIEELKMIKDWISKM